MQSSRASEDRDRLVAERPARRQPAGGEPPRPRPPSPRPRSRGSMTGAIGRWRTSTTSASAPTARSSAGWTRGARPCCASGSRRSTVWSGRSSIDTAGRSAHGVRAVLHALDAILARLGFARLGAAGEPFDPALARGRRRARADARPDRTIVAVVRPGYRLGDRVLRPAQVVVSRNPERHG